MPVFNPGSVYQMRDVLFTDWGLESHIDATDLKEKETMTGGGDRSTGDLILRTLLTLKTVPKEQREIIKLMRRYRKCLKVLGTYVVKLRPSNMGADGSLRTASKRFPGSRRVIVTGRVSFRVSTPLSASDVGDQSATTCSRAVVSPSGIARAGSVKSSTSPS